MFLIKAVTLMGFSDMEPQDVKLKAKSIEPAVRLKHFSLDGKKYVFHISTEAN